MHRQVIGVLAWLVGEDAQPAPMNLLMDGEIGGGRYLTTLLVEKVRAQAGVEAMFHLYRTKVAVYTYSQNVGLPDGLDGQRS
jgi:hypothetical protein